MWSIELEKWRYRGCMYIYKGLIAKLQHSTQWLDSGRRLAQLLFLPRGYTAHPSWTRGLRRGSIVHARASVACALQSAWARPTSRPAAGCGRAARQKPFSPWIVVRIDGGTLPDACRQHCHDVCCRWPMAVTYAGGVVRFPQQYAQRPILASHRMFFGVPPAGMERAPWKTRSRRGREYRCGRALGVKGFGARATATRDALSVTVRSRAHDTDVTETIASMAVARGRQPAGAAHARTRGRTYADTPMRTSCVCDTSVKQAERETARSALASMLVVLC